MYFSPSDNTDSHIQPTIDSANTDLYFGEYTFTEHVDAQMIVSKYDAGVYVSGIDDSYSNSDYPTSIFTPDLGVHFKVYNETDTSLFHNKYLITDPSDTCSDPCVLTGSHNWSVSANTENDENTIIIHNDTAANLFYQYFKASFNSLGGVLTPQAGCRSATSAMPVTGSVAGNVTIYPNPSTGNITISCGLASAENVSLDIYNVIGQKTASLIQDDPEQSGRHSINYTLSIPGVYLVRLVAGSEQFTKQVVISGE